jgi:hypothetical protein
MDWFDDVVDDYFARTGVEVAVRSWGDSIPDPESSSRPGHVLTLYLQGDDGEWVQAIRWDGLTGADMQDMKRAAEAIWARSPRDLVAEVDR